MAGYARSLEEHLQPATIRKRIRELTRMDTKNTKEAGHLPLVQHTINIIKLCAEAYKTDGSLFADGDALAASAPKQPRCKSPAKPEADTTRKPARTSLSRQLRLVSRRTLYDKLKLQE